MHDVVWTQRAGRNLNDIGEYIAQDDPVAAERIVRRIVEQVSSLTYYLRVGRTGGGHDDHHGDDGRKTLDTGAEPPQISRLVQISKNRRDVETNQKVYR